MNRRGFTKKKKHGNRRGSSKKINLIDHIYTWIDVKLTKCISVKNFYLVMFLILELMNNPNEKTNINIYNTYVYKCVYKIKAVGSFPSTEIGAPV